MVGQPACVCGQNSKQKDETKYPPSSSLVVLPIRKGSYMFSWAFVTIAKFSAFPSIFSSRNNFKPKLPSPNFSACCLIPMNSIKCLQAISIELCFSISHGTRPLCRSNADPLIIAIKAENNLHHVTRSHHEDQGQRSLVPVTTFWRLSHFISINMLPGHSAG